MTLKDAIKTLIDAKGLDVLKTPMSLNILSDFNAFEEYPASKNILKNIISEGYLDKIAFFYDNGIPVGDAPTAYARELYHKLGFRSDVSTYVLNAILEALGFCQIANSIDHEVHINSNNTSLVDSASENHIVFNGISLGESMKTIISKLCNKGFEIVERHHNRIHLKGTFCGEENAEIMIFGDKSGIVSSVRVIINSFAEVIYRINEERFINLLSSKYGTPYKADKNYVDLSLLFDDIMNFELIDSTKEALDYRWKVDGGEIQLHTITGSLFIEYTDDINLEISRVNTENDNLASI